MTSFRSADIRLLCGGSALPYELPVFHRAFKQCGNLPVTGIAIDVPDELKAYCRTALGENLQFADTSHKLMDGQVNGRLYESLMEDYL